MVFVPDLNTQHLESISDMDSRSAHSIPQETDSPLCEPDTAAAISYTSPSSLASTASTELCQRIVRGYLRRRREYLARQFALMEDGWSNSSDSNESFLNADDGSGSATISSYPSVEGSSTKCPSIQQQLRFPLHQIAEIGDLRKPSESLGLRNNSSKGEVSPPFFPLDNQVGSTTTSSDSTELTFRPWTPPPQMIHIEEFSPSITGEDQPGGTFDNGRLQLAPNTPETIEEETRETHWEIDTSALCNWRIGTFSFTPPTTTSVSTFTSYPQEALTLSFNNSRLEILPTPDSASSVTDLSFSEPNAMRGLPLDLPFDVPSNKGSQSFGPVPFHRVSEFK